MRLLFRIGPQCKTFLLLVLIFLAGALNIQAQAGKGKITGHVTDSSGGVLKGAKVSLDPTPLNVATDSQGQYLITDIDAGTYTLLITYVGFAPFTQAVEVRAGADLTVDAQLAIQTENTKVLVTAPRPSAEAAAVNEELTADNIVQVLPADVIRSLPNANMADALGRLPSVTLERDEGEGKYVQIRGTEPRLTNTTIDGMNVPSPESGVRQIKFDSIPADIVESVEINKTLQANRDGDGIGGSVNLVTKMAGERPTISLSGMGGYSPIDGNRPLTEFTGTLGRRFGAEKRWGALIGGSYDWNGRGIDDVEPVPDVNTLTGARTFEAMDFRQYTYYRTRWALAGSADYKLGEGSNLHVRGLYSDFKNYGDRTVYSLTDNTTGQVLYGSNGCSTDNTGATVQPCTGVPSFSTQVRRPDLSLANLDIGGNHVFTSSWLQWDITAGRASEYLRDDAQASFDSTLSSSTCQYAPNSTTDVYVPQWSPSCLTEAYDPANYTMSRIRINRGHSAQVNLQAGASMAKRYRLGYRSATIEFGGKFRNAHKFDDTYSLRLTPNVSIPLNQFPKSFTNTDYYNGSYPAGPNIRYQDIFPFVNANPGDFVTASNQAGNSANYGLVEKVSAGYLMNTIDFSRRLRFIAGVRFEGTNLRTVSFDEQTSTLSDLASGSYVSVLPSASVRYGFNSSTDIRLAYARGISRPDPQDIAQAVTYTLTSSGWPKNTATLGNPSLKAETGDNIDVLLEHYFHTFGMISSGYFYKRLSDPIVTETFTAQNFQPTPLVSPGTFLVTQPINAGSAWITGFEASYLQHFSFLPGAMAGLGLSANYGYTTSGTKGLPGRSDNPKLLRNAPNTWNISPTYDRGRVSLRVGLSYNQANIYSYVYSDGTPGGVDGPMSDIYFYSHLQIDAQASVRLMHGWNLVVYGLNLNNEVFGFYQGSPEYVLQREYYKPSFAAGMRWSLGEK